MPRAYAKGINRSGAALIAMGGGVIVWFVGFDPLWAVASVIAVGAVGAAVATLRIDENAAWDDPGRGPPPGIRRDVATIAASLAACDRLARPKSVRWMRALLVSDREDRLARSTAMRRMRALLNAELNDRGLDPGDRSGDEAIIALLGPDAIAILHPSDGKPVTAAAIVRCLDAVERLGRET